MDCRTQLATLAIEELDKGDFLMATKILTTGIRLEPNNHELYFERSICHHKLGDYQASLDDANAAIRLNSSDYNIYYQKGLALIGLSMLSEAVASFKKAIELRAKQEDSKLSDIFKLLRDATNELHTARRTKPGHNCQARSETVIMQNGNQSDANVSQAGPGTSNEPVDSTTDRPNLKVGPLPSIQTFTPTTSGKIEPCNNLVATNCNIRPNNSISSQQHPGENPSKIRVSSSANLIMNPHMSSLNAELSTMAAAGSAQLAADMIQSSHVGHQSIDHSKAGQFDWNIRRSERIFLHHSGEPVQAGSHYAILPPTNVTNAPRSKSNSNPSSINSARSATKRTHDESESQIYHSNNLVKSREGTDSHIDSDVDVDDSRNKNALPQIVMPRNVDDTSDTSKRVMIAPSSSMPATMNNPLASTSKDDSYSSKYKRLRRDRERARRGTSKLCTIKPSDLDELHKPINCAEKRFMRVIAPIDGWLYSGQLSVDGNCTDDGKPQYMVRLDGDATGGSYLFSQETVLNDVIKEVRVKTVSELRKGARICCYWSRQYKCLSTGVVTSRTFEATKSLVSVKYDNGDLSALPLDDLRLLPPDYPKYMSNCDPLLLARNGDGAHVSVTLSSASEPETHRFAIDNQLQVSKPSNDPEAGILVDEKIAQTNLEQDSAQRAVLPRDNEKSENSALRLNGQVEDQPHELEQEVMAKSSDTETEEDTVTIPPTDEIIDFITNDGAIKLRGEHQTDTTNIVDHSSMTNEADNSITTATQIDHNDSRASSEENNFGIEYRPWVFDGPPKKSKRYGRTYRDNYTRIRRGGDIIQVGDSAELMPRDESILPFIARIEGFWATSRGEMRVKVRWYYRLVETEGEPYELKDGQNALFETQHFDENDVQSIYRSTKILPWTEYCYYDPVKRSKHLRVDVKTAQ